MQKAYYVLLIFLLFCFSDIKALERKYVSQDSVFIKKVILKWSPLSLLDKKPNIAVSAELPLKNNKAINIQLGYILFDDRFYSLDIYGEVYEYSSRLNYARTNFILKTDFKWLKQAWFKKQKYVQRYIAVRTEYHLTNYIGKYKTCTEWKEIPPTVPMGPLNLRHYECISKNEYSYNANSHQFGFYYLWGKEIIFKNILVLDLYTGPGFRIDYTFAPRKEYGIPYPGDRFSFDFDLDPHHLTNFENEIKFLPNWAAGFRIGYSF